MIAIATEKFEPYDEEEKEVESPDSEMDVPPTGNTRPLTVNTLKAAERIDMLKWLKNFNFIYFIIGMMMVIYIIDLFCSGGNSSLKEPLFEVLKTVLLTASGFVFAKVQNK